VGVAGTGDTGTTLVKIDVVSYDGTAAVRSEAKEDGDELGINVLLDEVLEEMTAETAVPDSAVVVIATVLFSNWKGGAVVVLWCPFPLVSTTVTVTSCVTVT
jgi:hypothetical protein